MAQRHPEDNVTIDQVLKLVDKLTPAQQKKLRDKLNNKAWGKEWNQLIADVAQDNKGTRPLSEKEIYAEFTKHRRERRAKRAQGSR